MVQVWEGSLSEKSRDDLIRERDASVMLTHGLLEAVPGGVVHVGADGAIVAANKTALDILGFGYDAIRERYVQDWEPETVHEDGTPCAVEDYPVARALATGEPQRAMTIGVRRRSGEIVWCVFNAQPLLDDDGKVAGAVVCFIDVTEKKHNDDRRRESEELLRSVLHNAPSVILKSDLEGRIQFINRISPGLPAEVTPESVVGFSIYDHINERDHEFVRGVHRKVAETGEPEEYELKGKDGYDPNWYASRIGPVWRDGQVVETLTVVTNITERKEAERQHEALRAQLDAAQRLEALGRLAGGIAHDFNNLLTIILGHVDVVKTQVEEGAVTRSLGSIGDAADRAARMTRQLLAFSRQQALEPRALQINDVITDVLDMLTRLLGEDVRIELELADNLGLVFADQVQLERVVVNLATNARDAMPMGGRLVLRTRAARLDAQGARPAGDYVILDVVDEGVGITEADRQRMFEPFFTTKQRGEGTGLGLATVHGIVRQSGGQVDVRSSAEGTCVTVLLPRHVAEKKGTEPPPRAVESRSEGVDVLLVEDAPAVRRIIGHILKDAGHRVRDADSPEGMLADGEIRFADYRLLITDVVMPEMNGPELARRARAQAPDIKILFISGYIDESVQDLGHDLTGTAFVAKPFTADVLLEAVRSLLSEP